MFRPCFETLESREVFSNVVSDPMNLSENVGKTETAALVGMVDVIISGVRLVVGDFNNDGHLDLTKEGTGTLNLLKGASNNAASAVMADGSVRAINGVGVQGAGAVVNAAKNFIDDLIGWDFHSNFGMRMNSEKGFVEQDNLYKVKNAGHADSKLNQLASVTDLIIDPFHNAILAKLVASTEYYKSLALTPKW
jgi:hypothetical protein